MSDSNRNNDFKWNKSTSKMNEEEQDIQSISHVLKQMNRSSDFKQLLIELESGNVHLSYFNSLIDDADLQQIVLEKIKSAHSTSLLELQSTLSIEGLSTSSKSAEIESGLLEGNIVLQNETEKETVLLIPILAELKRDINIPEIEFTVIGPKEAFIEQIDTNLHLIRKRIPNSELLVKQLEVGTLTKTKVNVLYIDSIANDDNVQTMIQRIESIQTDRLIDSSVLSLLIADNSYSVFPEFLETERPDRTAIALCEGKVVVLVDGSPQALIAPSSLIEFFSALEDYFITWQLSSAIRLIRIFAVLFSIFATPLYVAFLTYHVELIPQDLLATLIMSRSIIPFPPILEVLFLELTIELLREAGARLPTKVGQTIGIVGGIVIGTAAVEAGLTSNVLLIIVALSALASFTTPVYRMGNTIRYIRFPFIIAAQLWGVISITLLFCLLLIHVLSIKSLGRPYLEPFYPLRVDDLKDSLVRLPIHLQSTRPFFLQTKNKTKFRTQTVKVDKDIDE